MSRARSSLRRWFTRERLRPSVFAAVALVATGAGIALYATNPFAQLELRTVDTRFQVRGGERPPSNLVVVGVDDSDIAQLGHWPFPYRVHARALDRITRDGPRAVAVDIQFSEHSPPPNGPAQDAA